MDVFDLQAKISLDTSEYEKKLEGAGKETQSFGDLFSGGVSGLAKAGVAMTGAVAGATGSIVAMSKQSASTSDNIDKMSQKIGISREAYQELDFIFSQSGASVDSLQAGMKTLTSAMDGARDGTKKNVEQFERLGVAVTNSDGTFRSQEDVMYDTLNALQGMSDQTEKARLATELFGRTGTELMPLLNGTSGSIDEMKQQAQDLGLVLSDDTIDAGVELTDTIDQAERAFNSIKTQIGTEVMPIFKNMLDWVLDNLPQIKETMSNVFDAIGKVVELAGDGIEKLLEAVDFMKEHFDVLAPIIAGVTAAIVTFAVAMQIVGIVQTVVGAIKAFQAANEGASIAQALLNAVMMANPIVLIVALIAGLVAAVVVLWNTNEDFRSAVIQTWKDIKSTVGSILSGLASVFSSVWNGIKSTVTSIVNGVKNTVVNIIKGMVSGVRGALSGIKGIFSNVWNGAKTIVSNAINAMKRALNFKWSLPSLKLPHISVRGGEAPFGIGGKGSLPSFSISWYAKAMKNGMILNEPTIFGIDKNNNLLGGGEAGSEAIVGTESLVNMINDAVGSSQMVALLYQILAILNSMDGNFESRISRAVNGTELAWNKRQLARLIREVQNA